MKLTEWEQDVLKGAEGAGAALAIEILTGIGDVMDADVMVPVSRAHISASAQEADLWFAEKMLENGAKTRVCATVNPSFDIKYFRDKDFISETDAELAAKCAVAYEKMGFVMNLTCTPYFDGNLPRFGENVAFSESSATAFVNSVVGARSNPESAQSALCSAIVGLTPRYGLLLDENRKAKVVVEVEADIVEEFDFSVLGWAAAKKVGRAVPLFRGNFHATTEGLLDLGAELNTAGRVPLFHVEDATPEAAWALDGVCAPRKAVVTRTEFDSVKENFSDSYTGADGVLLGCPHYSLEQIYCVYRRLAGRKVNIPVWILTSSSVISMTARMPLGRELEEAGVSLVGNTCVDQPCWHKLRGMKLLTDSPKCFYYTSRRGLCFDVMSAERCIDAALEPRR